MQKKNEKNNSFTRWHKLTHDNFAKLFHKKKKIIFTFTYTLTELFVLKKNF